MLDMPRVHLIAVSSKNLSDLCSEHICLVNEVSEQFFLVARQLVYDYGYPASGATCVASGVFKFGEVL